MEELLNRLLTNTANERVLRFLKVEGGKGLYFKSWREADTGFDEGAALFFNHYGRQIPEECKFSLAGHGILLHPLTGEIFAFKTARFSLFFNCDLAKSGLQNTHSLKKGNTQDGITDISELGGNWCFLDAFEDQQDQLLWSYERTQKTCG